MTLAQVSVLSDAERRYHDPKASAAPRAEQGTAMDLAMLSRMRVS